eukprot:363423-Chlamydomonas_euryale.AAC.8
MYLRTIACDCVDTDTSPAGLPRTPLGLGCCPTAPSPLQPTLSSTDNQHPLLLLTNAADTRCNDVQDARGNDTQAWHNGCQAACSRNLPIHAP